MSSDQEASDENTKTDEKAKVNTDTHSNEQNGPTIVRPSKDQSTENIDREKDKKQTPDEETLKTKNNLMEKQLIVILPPEKKLQTTWQIFKIGKQMILQLQLRQWMLKCWMMSERNS